MINPVQHKIAQKIVFLFLENRQILKINNYHIIALHKVIKSMHFPYNTVRDKKLWFNRFLGNGYLPDSFFPTQSSTC